MNLKPNKYNIVSAIILLMLYTLIFSINSSVVGKGINTIAEVIIVLVVGYFIGSVIAKVNWNVAGK